MLAEVPCHVQLIMVVVHNGCSCVSVCGEGVYAMSDICDDVGTGNVGAVEGC